MIGGKKKKIVIILQLPKSQILGNMIKMPKFMVTCRKILTSLFFFGTSEEYGISPQTCRL